MRKRTLIETIQAVINGGDTTPDVKRKAHPSVIGAYITAALSEIIYGSRRDLLANLAIPYTELPVVEDESSGVWYTTLPVRPIAGPLSITLATDSVGRAIAIRQSVADNFNLNFISPDQHCVTGIVRAKRLVYNSKPKDGNGQQIQYVNLYIIAEFNELSDTDYVVIPGAENQVIRLVLQAMGYSNQVPEDVLNNIRVDREANNQA